MNTTANETKTATTGAPRLRVRRADERGHASHGWLDAYHSFSFGEYYDPQWMGFRSLRVINDDLVLPGMGFATHPHRDMEIVTYVLHGALAHKDSMGNGRTIRAGEMQYMSAGSGVEHSEFNPSADEAVRLLQIWIKPDEKGAAPRYAERSLRDARTGVFHLLASKAGRDGSVAIRQDADLWLAKLEVGQTVSRAVPAGRHGWLHVAEGKVVLNGIPLASGDAVAVEGPEPLTLAAESAAQVLLFDLA
ncbi:MAG TPA: pirin family protein [Candidatus Methylacidiphilales bacterium]